MVKTIKIKRTKMKWTDHTLRGNSLEGTVLELRTEGKKLTDGTRKMMPERMMDKVNR